MLDLTVAIPTFNGADRIPQVLNRLIDQTGIDNLIWEILIIDNNSKDHIFEVIATYQANWKDQPTLRYCVEPNQGSGFARDRAVQEAQSPLIAFLDDDNLPERNWISEAYDFAYKHPKAGAWASQIHGDFEGELPPNFERIQSFFAITQRGQQASLYNSWQRVLPPSAGLVVRREAWLNSIPVNGSILKGRRTNNMLAGADTEMLGYIQQSGWEIWYNPSMEIVHKITHNRLEKKYLLEFFCGIGLGRYVTRMLHVKSKWNFFWVIAYTINDLRKVMFHLLRHGLHIKTDVVAACELALYTSSLISPLYLQINGHLRKTKNSRNLSKPDFSDKANIKS